MKLLYRTDIWTLMIDHMQVKRLLLFSPFFLTFGTDKSGLLTFCDIRLNTVEIGRETDNNENSHISKLKYVG